MTPDLQRQIADQVDRAKTLYHRLVIVVGPPRSGKTTALRGLREEQGWPLINLNLALSEKLLDLTVRQRALRVADIVGDIVDEGQHPTVMLDNIEMLFHPDLHQDPVRLLQSLSRNRTIIATWRGAHAGRSLVYAAPDHPEYRRFDDPEALLVAAKPVDRGPPASQEHSA
jgi:hypothetical protein